MAQHAVKCRVCQQVFDAKAEEENVTWVMPSKLWYYHKKCFEDWRQSKEGLSTDEQEEWVLFIYDLIARDLKGSYNWWQIEKQRKKFIGQRMTDKGIYYTLYWHFLIKKNPWKEEYGIGIVPCIYKEAQEYWVKAEEKAAGIMRQVIALHNERIVVEDRPVAKRGKRGKRVIKVPD